MLPPGLAAQPVGAEQAGAMRLLLPGAQSVVELLAGACSCDLVRPRDSEPREDERHLRARFARLGLRREEIIRRLERHRRRSPVSIGSAGPAALAGLVAEHARNAGPSLYLLRFGEEFSRPVSPASSCLVSRVREAPETWLEEGRPVLVIRQHPPR